MKKKYTKAKVEIIPLKTEGFICTDSDKNKGGGSDFGNGGGDGDNDEDERDGDAKAFDVNGINDFPSDSIPPTKE